MHGFLSSLSTVNPAHSTLPSVLSVHLSSHFRIPSLPPSLPPLFLQHHSSFPTVSSVLRILTHMADFDEFTRLRGAPPHTWMTSLCLNHPLINSAGGAVHLVPVPNRRQITPHMLLPACFSNHDHLRSHHCAHFPSVVYPLLLNSTVFCIFSSPSPAPAQPWSPPSYPRRRCWSLAEIWRSQKWSVAGPWSFRTGRRSRARACLSRWVEPEAGQSCHFPWSEGSHGDPQGGKNGKWTGHLERVTEYENMN